MIRFEHFGWQFSGAASAALDNVSLHIGRGEFVAVAGPSGSGKSTLALAMCGLLIGRQAGIVGGQVRVADRDVATTPLHRIAEVVGLVQQNPEAQFATLNVRDELAFGLENRSRPAEQIERATSAALESLSIEHLRGRDLATLSGGEKQRVAVASIVAGNPSVLVLDEPTASLDPDASRVLFGSLARLCREQGLTVVIIEHKLAQLLPLHPRLVCLEGGRVMLDAPDGADVDLRHVQISAGARTPRPTATQTEQDTLARMQNVTVEYEGHVALRDVSLRVVTGEVVAVLGPNGGGKTTLLHALMGLVVPSRGSVRVGDVEVSAGGVSRLARDVGLVFQNADHQLVAQSVQDEALFAARRFGRETTHATERAVELLTQAGLAGRLDDHPYRLSWGQKRRLNLISAVLHEPRLLLLDEPFAGQDWENVALLLEVIREIVCGEADETGRSTGGPRGACLMVTHDARIVQQSCTRVLFVEGGRVTVDAPTPEAFERLIVMGHDAYVPTPLAVSR